MPSSRRRFAWEASRESKTRRFVSTEAVLLGASCKDKSTDVGNGGIQESKGTMLLANLLLPRNFAPWNSAEFASISSEGRFVKLFRVNSMANKYSSTERVSVHRFSNNGSSNIVCSKWRRAQYTRGTGNTIKKHMPYLQIREMRIHANVPFSLNGINADGATPQTGKSILSSDLRRSHEGFAQGI